jgi:predicted Zn-dependent peptidase
MSWRALLCIAFPISVVGACAPGRAPLPPPPPPKSPSELGAWMNPPPPAPEPVVSLPMSIERVALPNGIGVTIVTRPETKTTALELWVPSAGDRSEGQVAAMADALRAGTRVKDGSVLVNPKLAFEPIFIDTNASGTTLSWQALPRASEQAIALLSSFAFKPAFDPEETEIRLRGMLTSILRDAGGMGHLANLSRKSLPGVEIPTPEEDARGLFKLKPDVLRHVHRCTMSPAGAELAVVGPLPAEQVGAWVRAAFADVVVTPRDASCDGLGVAPLDPEKTRLSRLELAIIYGGTFDPTVFMAVPGPALTSEDFVPFALLAEVLAARDEGPAQALRHMGATYGIHAGLNASLPGMTLLEVSGQFEPDNAQSALRQIVEDMHALADTLTEAQVDEVKRRWRNAYINTLSSNRSVASTAIAQTRRGRAPEALKDWPNELMQISIERCREVGRRWLSDAQPSVAVAGLPVKLVRGLGLGAHVREMYWTDKLQQQKKAL